MHLTSGSTHLLVSQTYLWAEKKNAGDVLHFFFVNKSPDKMQTNADLRKKYVYRELTVFESLSPHFLVFYGGSGVFTAL